MNSENPPYFCLEGIEKKFPGVHALKNIDFDLKKGECVALLGENGAGKSTLIKIMGGAQRADSGILKVDEEVQVWMNPIDSINAGVAVIYQEFNLVPGLTVAENILLGIEPQNFGIIRKKEERKRVLEILKKIGAELDPDTICENLTVAEKQLVEIGKAIIRDAKILIMDEPSAALTKKEVQQLYLLIDDLKVKGIGIVYVSHRLEEIERVADRAIILRDGERIGQLERHELDRTRIIEMMVGRKLDNEFPSNIREPGDSIFRIENLSRGSKVKNISFEVREGEILAFTGLVGAGRTETVRILFGADEKDYGKIELFGKELTLRNPSDAIESGICLLTEDRKEQGLILAHSIKENFGLPNLKRFSFKGWVNKSTESSAFENYVKKLKIKISGHNQVASQLSGGNQQKVVMAKWLERNADILIFDEPTRGIDVGAKFEIYQWMNQLAKSGKGIVMISSELPEVLGMSDRILVMKDGEIKAEFKNDSELTQETIMSVAMEAK
ncbi:MAG: D-xylose ABC transporter ATP-binding protein [Opitutae bacterium]|nr:D-xylose ABC transporter ATP-binding protein [Opitutae bacterium]